MFWALRNRRSVLPGLTYFLSLNFLSDCLSDKKLRDKKMNSLKRFRPRRSEQSQKVHSVLLNTIHAIAELFQFTGDSLIVLGLLLVAGAGNVT